MGLLVRNLGVITYWCWVLTTPIRKKRKRRGGRSRGQLTGGPYALVGRRGGEKKKGGQSAGTRKRLGAPSFEQFSRPRRKEGKGRGRDVRGHLAFFPAHVRHDPQGKEKKRGKKKKGGATSTRLLLPLSFYTVLDLR